MKVVVLTTSYPRSPEDVVGRFVADAVEHVRARGVTVEVVSPLDFHHFGIAYGYGVMGNLRRRPWLAAALPAMLASFAVAARRASRDADLVHAHWLPAGAVAAATGKPFVVQLWGTDVELARRWPALARAGFCAAPDWRSARRRSSPRAARELGARAVRVIPSGVEMPATVAEPEEPPHVLYAGRLSRGEGRAASWRSAARGLPLVVAGDGPLRDRLPGTLGWVAHDELLRLYERAAVVVCPSLREGFGVSCAEAMAHGRPVVASAVGGLRDLVVDGETGLLVPPGDVAALRAALERLLADAELRRRLGAAARARAAEHFSWDALGVADRHRLRGRPAGASANLGHVPRELTIDGVRIADDTDCWVIAEIGHNHQGSLDHCKQLFAEAAACGANAVKLQKRDNYSLYTHEAFNRPYENENSYGPTYGLHREALEFGRSEYQELKAYAAELGVTFFATSFDFKSAELLADLDMPAYKIASGDLTNTPLLSFVAETRQADDRLDRRRDARRRPPRARHDRGDQPADRPAPVHRRLPRRVAGARPARDRDLPRGVPGGGRRLLRATTTGSRCRSPRTCSAAASSRSTSR